MGTRGAMGVRIDGRDKIAYNHFDSYPDGLGDSVVLAAQEIGVERMRDLARALTVVPDRPPTDEEWERLAAHCDEGVGEAGQRDWYKLLRHTQGELGALLECGLFKDSAEFLRDSLFCEWAYIVNLDEETIEVYRGFQKEEHTKGRYSSPVANRGYYPVALLVSYKLNDIPKDWAERVEGEVAA